MENCENDVSVESPTRKEFGFESRKSESIQLKPSTELIPDEYEHCDPKDGLVHIFKGSSQRDDERANLFQSTLTTLGYTVTCSDLSDKEKVLGDLELISSANEVTEKSCVIILFLGSFEKDGCFLCEDGNEISSRDVWVKFAGSKFRNKPKIFIFHPSEYIKRVQRDTTIKDVKEHVYKVPAEADILIVYYQVKAYNNSQFIYELCENIKKYGKRDDVMTLITMSSTETGYRPITLSTLTRKFYFTSSESRGYHLELHEGHSSLSSDLDEIHSRITKLQEKNLVKKQGGNKRSESAINDRVGSMKDGNFGDVTRPSSVKDSPTKKKGSSEQRTMIKKLPKVKPSAPSERPPWR